MLTFADEGGGDVWQFLKGGLKTSKIGRHNMWTAPRALMIRECTLHNTVASCPCFLDWVSLHCSHVQDA